MAMEKRERVINEYYYDGKYPRLDIFEKKLQKKKDGDWNQYEVKLCMNYTDFLTSVQKYSMTVQTSICQNGKLQYKFLSYPNFNLIISEMDEYYLTRLMNNKEGMYVKAERGVGLLIDRPHDYFGYDCFNHEYVKYTYHIGNEVLPEYEVYFHRGKSDEYKYVKPEYFVRMPMQSDAYRWIKIEPIIWTVDKKNNQLISNKINLQLNEEVINDNDKRIEYINNILYRDMDYHPEQYLSNNIIDKMIIYYQLCKYKNCLEQTNTESKSKILKKSK